MSFSRAAFFLLFLLAGAAAAEAQAPAGTVPTVIAPLPNQTLGAGAAAAIDLGAVFGLPGVTGPVVQFTTVLGPVNVELFSQAAPLNTANFLSYVNSGAYTNTLFHRSVVSFVEQGGGYTVAGNTVNPVVTGSGVTNEYSIANTRGTIAMAKQANAPNSATSQWFFNLVDNTTSLGPTNNSGYTVFGEVIGTGMTVIDAVAAEPIYDASAVLGSDFNTVPLINYKAPLAVSQFVLISKIAPIPIFPPDAVTPAVLAFSAFSSNPSVVTASASGRMLTLTAGILGTTTVTVTAVDSNGDQTATTFAVTVTNVLVMAQPPVSQTVASGSTAVFSFGVTAAPAATFQWLLNSVPLAGATGARLVLTGATAANQGSYTCVATNAAGTVTSPAATLAVVATANPGRLGNLSVLSNFAAGQILTVGFVTGGSGTNGTQALLIRADGPTLGGFGVAGTMADPNFKVIPLGQSVATSNNDNWGSNSAAVVAADAATGAFALTTGSLDAAEVATLTPGGYSVQVSGTGAGTALTEVYDTTPVAAYALTVPRLVNVSCNTTLPTAGTLTTGFTVGGTTAKTVLIRASGPTLAGFGLTGTMADPQLVVNSSATSAVLATNTGWGGDPQIAAAAASVSAFAFTSATSKDSAVLLTLAPGGYTAVVSSASGGGGTTVVEVYEIP
jgi:cyclophilin family peptidyl-prolyl cis-trans isomerase